MHLHNFQVRSIVPLKLQQIWKIVSRQKTRPTRPQAQTRFTTAIGVGWGMGLKNPFVDNSGFRSEIFKFHHSVTLCLKFLLWSRTVLWNRVNDFVLVVPRLRLILANQSLTSLSGLLLCSVAFCVMILCTTGGPELVSWSLTSLFSTNMAISETNGHSL